MSCNCKTEETQNDGVNINLNLGKSILRYAFKFGVFLLSLILLPIIMLATIWLMFDLLVLSKQFNTMGVILKLAETFKNKKTDDDDDDDEYYDADEYEMVDVETITNDIK